jgi:hypothetical protein
MQVSTGDFSGLLKNVHLRRSPRPSSLRRYKKRLVVLTIEFTAGAAQGFILLRISGALHLSIFDQPYKSGFFSTLLEYLDC